MVAPTPRTALVLGASIGVAIGTAWAIADDYSIVREGAISMSAAVGDLAGRVLACGIIGGVVARVLGWLAARGR